MGYFAEINTLLRLPHGPLDPKTLVVGETYSIEKDKERVFPLHCAILLEGANGVFYGYCVAESAILKECKTTVTFKVLSLFTENEQKIYTTRFTEAAKLTGEIE